MTADGARVQRSAPGSDYSIPSDIPYHELVAPELGQVLGVVVGDSLDGVADGAFAV